MYLVRLVLFQTALFVFAATACAATACAANNEKVAAFLEPLVQSEKLQDLTGVDDKTAEKLRTYYQSRSFKPVWGRDTGIKGKGKALFAEIQTSRVHGFDPAWYSVDELKKYEPGNTCPRNACIHQEVPTASI